MSAAIPADFDSYRDEWPMLLHAIVSFRKTGLSWCALLMTQLGVLAWCYVLSAQEPPALEAPDLEPPRAESAPAVSGPQVGNALNSAPARIEKPVAKAAETGAPKSVVKPATTGGPKAIVKSTETGAPKSAEKPTAPNAAARAATPKSSGSVVAGSTGSGSARPGNVVISQPTGRPMLAIPGLTTPAARTTVGTPRPLASQTASMPALAAPAEATPGLVGRGGSNLGMRSLGQAPADSRNGISSGSFAGTARGAGTVSPLPESTIPGEGGGVNEGVRDSIPLGLEPLADDPPPAKPAVARPGAFGNPTDRTVRSTPGSLEDDPRIPSVIRRNIGGFQRYMRQPAPANSRPVGAARTKAAQREGEPETDATVKKRLEKELRETLGDRVKSVEVRVSGRNVLVAAKPAWFWQRRGVKRSIETLPSMQNYRVRVDLDD